MNVSQSTHRLHGNQYSQEQFHGWPSTQPNRIEHNLAAHNRTAHNPAALWCAGSVARVTRMGRPSSQPNQSDNIVWANVGPTSGR